MARRPEAAWQTAMLCNEGRRTEVDRMIDFHLCSGVYCKKDYVSKVSPAKVAVSRQILKTALNFSCRPNLARTLWFRLLLEREA